MNKKFYVAPEAQVELFEVETSLLQPTGGAGAGPTFDPTKPGKPDDDGDASDARDLFSLDINDIF